MLGIFKLTHLMGYIIQSNYGIKYVIWGYKTSDKK